MMTPIATVPVEYLHEALGCQQPLDYPDASRHKPMTRWVMEEDDAPIFRYIYRQLRPRRHLEFGTWLGMGTTYCLQECDATVWTINTPGGERYPDGRWAYPLSLVDPDDRPASEDVDTSQAPPGRTPSDVVGLIGQQYLQHGYGHRVCQVYCDSQQWDITAYPPGFFDTVLIDGGHQEPVVSSDTRKAVHLLRPGGVVMWHDYCPDAEVLSRFTSTQGVAKAIDNNLGWLSDQLSQLFWINPSWILLGVKA